MRVEADGLEKQLDELKSRWHRYTQHRWLELSKEFTQDCPTVFIEDVNQDGERHRNFIFKNEHAVKQIRWKHILSDCEMLTAEFSSVTERAELELARTDAYLQEAHANIMKNVDPKVVKLTKKMKIVVVPGALDGLWGEEPEDE